LQNIALRHRWRGEVEAEARMFSVK